jgi:hypothetical protein
MFRISPQGRESIIDVDTLEAVRDTIRLLKPGRYHVDEIASDPRPSGHTSRRWGLAIKRPDGSVELEPDPCEA